MFATKTVNEAGADGLFYGNAAQLGIQAVGVVATVVFAAVMTYIILKIIGSFMALRASEKEEVDGLDITQHGEDAYPEQYSNDAIININ